MPQINPVLLRVAEQSVWLRAGREKSAVVPADPAAAAAGGGAPPMPGGMPPPSDPSMMGAAPPTDPSMMGGAPPMPGMPPPMPGGMPGAVDPMTGMPAGGQPGGQKMKPEQYMQMLDYRLYNLQQQITTLLNHAGVKMDPGVLVTPPGAPMGPPPESAIQGGPMDTGQGQGGGGGGDSSIAPIDPIQGASPELAAGGGGGGEKMGFDTLTFADLLEKLADEGGDVGRKYSPPSQALRGPHPGRRPATQNISAGGSKDPETRTDTNASMGPANAKAKAAAHRVGHPYSLLQNNAPASNASAVAAMLRSRTLGI